jgi:hypothetical protein
MKRPVFFTSTGLAALILTACVHNVNLSISNPTAKSLDADVTVASPSGVQNAQMSVGTVQPNGKANQQFTIHNDDHYTVTANLPGSATVYTESRTVTSSAPKDIDASVTLAVNAPTLDPNTAAQTISDAFEKMGPDVGFTPLPIVGALQTLFGGLLVLVPPSGGSSDYRVVFQLTPDQFGSSVITPANFPWPGSNTQNTVDIDSEVSAKVGASVPLLSQVAANFDNSSVYSVQWSLLGYGMVPKTESASWTYQNALSGLSPVLKQQLCNALSQPSAFLLYVNKFYVIENASFSVKQAQKISVGGSVDGGTIITASGAWTFSNSTSTLQTFQNSVLNIDGVRSSPGDVSCTHGAAPGPAIEGPGGGGGANTASDITILAEPTATFHLTDAIVKQAGK